MFSYTSQVLHRTSLSCRSLHCPFHANMMHQGSHKNAEGFSLGLREKMVLGLVWPAPAPLPQPHNLSNLSVHKTLGPHSSHLFPHLCLHNTSHYKQLPLTLLLPQVPAQLYCNGSCCSSISPLFSSLPSPLCDNSCSFPDRSWLWAPLTWNHKLPFEGVLAAGFSMRPKGPLSALSTLASILLVRWLPW